MNCSLFLAKIQKVPFSSYSLIKFDFFLHFGVLQNNQNHPIRSKHPHIQVLWLAPPWTVWFNQFCSVLTRKYVVQQKLIMANNFAQVFKKKNAVVRTCFLKIFCFILTRKYTVQHKLIIVNNFDFVCQKNMHYSRSPFFTNNFALYVTRKFSLQ